MAASFEESSAPKVIHPSLGHWPVIKTLHSYAGTFGHVNTRYDSLEINTHFTHSHFYPLTFTTHMYTLALAREAIFHQTSFHQRLLFSFDSSSNGNIFHRLVCFLLPFFLCLFVCLQCSFFFLFFSIASP